MTSIGLVNGKIHFPKVAPYLGIGWTKTLTRLKGWAFSTDIGVLYLGSPRTSLHSSGCTILTQLCDMLAADLVRENAALNEEVRKHKSYRAYPVVRIGLSYTF